MHWTLVEDTQRLFAGHPQEMQDALDALDEAWGEYATGSVIGLDSPDREAVWAALG